MKVKIEVKSWNYYSPPPHTHTLGGGLFDLPCTQGQFLKDAKLFKVTLNTKNSYCLQKLTYLGYIKLHGDNGNPSGTVVGSFASRPKINTCVPHILSWIFFSLTLIQEKNKLSVTGKTKMSLRCKEKLARIIYLSPIM